MVSLSLSGSAFLRPGSGRLLPLLPPVFLGKRRQPGSEGSRSPGMRFGNGQPLSSWVEVAGGTVLI